MATLSSPPTTKRIIVCCDGTWQNSDSGGVKPPKSREVPTLQVASNVTRISRSFKRNCSDGVFQILYYQSGVGSGGSSLARMLGGALGIGIAENIREAYAYICANYVDGDEIILVGFSRGAFTARSIAGMISNLGLLTRDGMEFFYPIFKDMQNWQDLDWVDSFPGVPFFDKPKGEGAAEKYRAKLATRKLTRVRTNGGEGDLIHVKAIDLSNKIEHAFQALALDETRGPFSPALWGKSGDSGATNLRQVWFPGGHANIGGGWADEGVSVMSLAWMMDQLTSVGCEFTDGMLEKYSEQNMQRYRDGLVPIIKNPKIRGPKDIKTVCNCNCPCNLSLFVGNPLKVWADEIIYDANRPVRPWALHQINQVYGAFYDWMGRSKRSPGMYKKVNPKTGKATKSFLEETNERIHPSVRVRLACHGLGCDDREFYQCKSLLKYWRPRRISAKPSVMPKSPSWNSQVTGAPAPILRSPRAGAQGNSIDSQSSQDSEAGPSRALQGEGDDSSEPESAGESPTAGYNRRPMVTFTDGPSQGPENPNEDELAAAGVGWVWEYVGPEESAPPIRTLVEESLGPYELQLAELCMGKTILDYAEREDFTKYKFPSIAGGKGNTGKKPQKDRDDQKDKKDTKAEKDKKDKKSKNEKKSVKGQDKKYKKEQNDKKRQERKGKKGKKEAKGSKGKQRMEV